MRPSSGSTIWATVRTFSSSHGSEITAGPAKWGFFDGSYVSGDSGITGGWNHVASSSRVNELQIGVRRATESFGTHTDADLTRILKSTVGYTLPQFHPELNTPAPSRRSRLARNHRHDEPDFMRQPPGIDDRA
jgi:hypothetical protein